MSFHVYWGERREAEIGGVGGERDRKPEEMERTKGVKKEGRIN